MDPGLVVAILLAAGFAMTNGLHDASNAIATLVATRGATPHQAIVLASTFNLLGPLLLGAAVADTIGGASATPTSNACSGSIVPNRAKIEATLANARATVALRASGEPLDSGDPGALSGATGAAARDLGGRSLDPSLSTSRETVLTLESLSPEGEIGARDVVDGEQRAPGAREAERSVGPTTLYALMQACGLVDDRLAGCPARPAVGSARRAVGLAVSRAPSV